MDWVYPVYKPTTRREGTQSAVRQALPREEAYRLIGDPDDLRPLLVLREFSTFDDPDNERLSRMLYTESTVTLSHWFRCVRLPPHVEESDHPFHNLFAGADAPQLFLATRDGATVMPFDHRTRAADLEELMVEMLDQLYDGRPERHCDQLVKMLPRMDKLDAEIARLKEEVDQAIETDGPKHARTRKAMKKLAQAEKEMQGLMEKKNDLEDLPLKAQ